MHIVRMRLCVIDSSKQCRSQMGTLVFNFGFTVHVEFGIFKSQ